MTAPPAATDLIQLSFYATPMIEVSHQLSCAELSAIKPKQSCLPKHSLLQQPMNSSLCAMLQGAVVEPYPNTIAAGTAMVTPISKLSTAAPCVAVDVAQWTLTAGACLRVVRMACCSYV